MIWFPVLFSFLLESAEQSHFVVVSVHCSVFDMGRSCRSPVRILQLFSPQDAEGTFSQHILLGTAEYLVFPYSIKKEYQTSYSVCLAGGSSWEI